MDVRTLVTHLVAVLERVAALGRGEDPFGVAEPVAADDAWPGRSAWSPTGTPGPSRRRSPAWTDSSPLPAAPSCSSGSRRRWGSMRWRCRSATPRRHDAGDRGEERRPPRLLHDVGRRGALPDRDVRRAVGEERRPVPACPSETPLRPSSWCCAGRSFEKEERSDRLGRRWGHGASTRPAADSQRPHRRT